MALSFNPPDWLVQDYFNRKNPYQELLGTALQAGQTYAGIQQQNKFLGLKQQEAALQKQGVDLQRQQVEQKGFDQFTESANPAFLPPNIRGQIGKPIEGPVTQSGVSPAKDPIVAFSEQFMQQNPGGYKGLEAQKTKSEIAKNEAMAAMYGRGGPSAGNVQWKINPFTGQYEPYPTKLPGAGMTPPIGGVPSGIPTSEVDDPFAGLDYRTRMKRVAEKPKASGSLQNTLREYDNMIAEANAIKNDPAIGSATGFAAPLARVPGTGAKRVGARLETLKAKTLLNVLAALKDLSSTGASGFGQLSNIEGENLRNSISTLDRTQGTADFKSSIDRFITEMQQRKDVLRNTFTETYGESAGANTALQNIPTVTSQAEYESLPSGSPYLWNGKTGRKP